jgi:hypothetical protein
VPLLPVAEVSVAKAAVVVIAVAVRVAVVDAPVVVAIAVRAWTCRLKPTTKKRILKSPALRV